MLKNANDVFNSVCLSTVGHLIVNAVLFCFAKRLPITKKCQKKKNVGRNGEEA